MRKIISKLILLAAVSGLIVACDKNDSSLDGAGNTLVKIMGGGTDPVVVPLDVDPPSETIVLFDLRRDAANAAELNKAATITLTNTQVYLDTFNVHNGTNYELLPLSAYTITAASGVTVSGDTWTVTLAPGEFARDISITLDKTQMDLSLQYGFGLKITQTNVGTVAKDNGEALVNVLIKNKYDAAYEVTGSMVDAASSALTGDFPMAYHLITTGERSVIGYSPKYAANYVDILSSGAGSVYGAFCPIFEFDASNNIIKVTNAYGQPASNGRYAQIDPSGINKWDPATGNIDVKFFMFQPSVVPLPNPRVSFSWHMENSGPR